MEDDAMIIRLEQQVPLEAPEFMRGVYQKALASGRTVVVSRADALYSVTSSGSSKIKDIDADVLVTDKHYKIQ